MLKLLLQKSDLVLGLLDFRHHNGALAAATPQWRRWPFFDALTPAKFEHVRETAPTDGGLRATGNGGRDGPRIRNGVSQLPAAVPSVSSTSSVA